MTNPATSFEAMEMLQQTKNKCKEKVLEEGIEQAKLTLRNVCRRRGGKFKISEKQFVDELANMWVAGSLCAAERAMRLAELDKSATVVDIQADLHLLVHDIYQITKKRLGLIDEVGLGDLIYGKYSTENALKDIRGERA